MDELLAELESRLRRIAAIPPALRALVLERCRAFAPEQLAQFVQSGLQGVEFAFHAFNEPSLREFAARLAALETPAEVLAAVGGSGDPEDPRSWGMLTSGAGRSPQRHCAIIIGEVLMSLTATATGDAFLEVMTWSGSLFSATKESDIAPLRQRIEERLGLGAEQYASREAFRARLATVDGESRHLFALIVSRVARSYFHTGQPEQGYRITEWLLELEDGEEASHAGLVAGLERWERRQLDALAGIEDLSPEMRAASERDVVRTLIILVDQLGRGSSVLNEPERGYRLSAALLGIAPEGPIDLSRLHALSERMPRSFVRDALNIWAELARPAGHLLALGERLHDYARGPDWQPGRIPPLWDHDHREMAVEVLTAVARAFRSSTPPLAGHALWLGALGLEERDLDTEAGGDEIFYRLANVPRPVALRLVAEIAASYQMTTDHEAAVIVGERFLQLPRDRYSSILLRDHLSEYWEGNEPSLEEHQFAMNLAMSLHTTGHYSDAWMLAQAVFPEADREGDAPSLASIRKVMAGWPAEWFDHTLGYFAHFGLTVGSGLGILGLVAERFEVPEDRFEDRAWLAEHLPRATAGMPPMAALIMFETLAVGLREIGRLEASRSLLEALLGLDEAWYRHPSLPDDEEESWHLRREPLMRLLMARTLAQTLQQLGRPGDAAVLLEAVLGLEPGCRYQPRGLLRRCAEFLAGNAMNAGASAYLSWLTVPALLDVLAEGGRLSEAQDLAWSNFCDPAGELSWLDPDGGLMPMLVLPIAEQVLRLVGTETRELGLTLCEKVVEYMRRRVWEQVFTYRDWRALLHSSQQLRQGVVAVGSYWAARAGDRDEAERIRVRVLCWDAELSQRQVIERFLLERPPRPNVVDPALQPKPEWPSSRLPEGTDEVSVLGCFDVEAGPGEAVVRQTTGRDHLASEDSFVLLQQAVREGIEEKQLATSLDDDDLLLRGGFSADGKLVWGLYARAGETLRLLASDAGLGATTDNARLRQAGDEHDRAIAHLWQRYRLARTREAYRGRAEEVGRDLEAARGDGEQWPAARAGAVRLAAALREAELDGPAAALAATVPPLFDPAATTCPARRDLALIGVAWKTFWAEHPLEADKLGPALDQATHDFLCAVERVWRLDAVAEHLTTHSHVLVQVDDALHAVPVAFLRVGGRYLFERVASVRRILSVLLNDLLGTVEGRAHEEARLRRTTGASAARRALAMSYFRPDDAVGHAGAARLYDELARVAEKHSGYVWRSAASEPAGSHAVLATALADDEPVQVVVICGHGTAQPTGIRLGDGIWSGSEVMTQRSGSEVWSAIEACDLRRIEFLVQVSCSIGRVLQGSLRDVEGFCVELAVHRACGVLAGLWPLHTQDAPWFAARVVDAYLTRREEDLARLGEVGARVTAGQRVWRGRALAQARRDWLAGERAAVAAGRPPRRLHTVAALDLFGLG